MPENHLTSAWINYGLSPVASRMALRDMVAGLLADGPGATLGVHGLGVFYCLRTKERFVIRDGVVYRCPQRDVIKLRPAKADVTELDESPDVRISFETTFSGDNDYAFTSTSRAGQFVATAPTAIIDDVWRLFYSVVDGLPGYGLGDSSLSDSDIAACASYYDDTPNAISCVRLEHSLGTIMRRTNPSGGAFGKPIISAECSDASTNDIYDAVYGGEVSAHFRSRALTL